MVQVDWQVLVEGPTLRRRSLELSILMVYLVDQCLLIWAHEEILVELHAIKDQALLVICLLFRAHGAHSVGLGHFTFFILVSNEFAHIHLLKKCVQIRRRLHIFIPR